MKVRKQAKADAKKAKAAADANGATGSANKTAAASGTIP